MPLHEPIVPSRYARYFLHLAGVRREAVLSAAGLRPEMVEDADIPLTIGQFEALLSASESVLGRTDLGFEVGRLITVESHSALGLVMLSQPTLGALLATAARYHTLITPCFPVEYRPGTPHCDYVIRVAASMSQPALHSFLELHAVAIHRQLREVLGAASPVEILVSCPPPAHIGRYQELGPPAIQFSAAALPEVRLVLPSRLAARPLPGRTDATAAGLPLLPARESRSYAAWVELMLREAEGIQPTLETLAGLLGLSARTLSRKLAAEGIDLRKLALAVRHERACRMLTETGFSQAHISQCLGFADETGFIRAFRRTAGISPGQWRNLSEKSKSVL